jgi:pilus assembly protein Flp/PilA
MEPFSSLGLPQVLIFLGGEQLQKEDAMSFRKDEGQGMVEYALIILLIALVLIIVLVIVGSQLSGLYSSIISSFPD